MIFVIGGNGFVGSAICRQLEKKNLEFEILTRQNIGNFMGKACDVVINANGNSKKFVAKEDPIHDFNESVLSVRTSLEGIKYRKYVYLSSCDVYEDCSSPEITKEEKEIDVTKQSTYGFHKYLAEQCVRHVADEWLIFRMGGFVGEGLRKNAIFDIFNGGPLWLAPDSELQFINVDEAAEIIIDMATSDIKNDIYNLCGDGVISLKEVMDKVGKNVPVKENSPKVKYEVSIEKIKLNKKIRSTRENVFGFIKKQHNLLCCPICGSSKYTPFLEKNFKTLVICNSCRHIYWDKMPNVKELDEYYEYNYTSSHNQMKLQIEARPYYSQHVKELKSLVVKKKDKPNFVDFGCSFPVLLEEAKHDFFCIGVESDLEAQQYGRQHGILMYDCESFLEKQPESSIDILRFSHVLEHITEPKELLYKLAKKVCSGGIIYITQPNFPIYKTEAQIDYIKDSIWPEHLHFFCMNSLKKMVRDCGFEVIKAFTHTNEENVYAEQKNSLDINFANKELIKISDCGDLFFGKKNNFPYYCGENSVLFARKL